jgi:hypothetical protein
MMKRAHTREMQKSFTPARTTILQRKCDLCPKKKKLVQRSSLGRAEAVPPIVHEALRSPGQPLSASTRTFFEPKFGHDFGKVRIHTDDKATESARAINARAYTTDQNIVFGSGEYDTRSPEGKRLLAHELTHVVQQSHRPVTASYTLNETGDSFERSADETADRLLAQNESAERIMTFKVSPPVSLIQRQIGTPADPKIQGMFTIIVEPESGRAELRASGPEDAPVVGSPTIGIRRDPSGQYHLLFGGKDKVISIGEIPSLLRGAVSQGASAGGSALRMGFRIPSCREMIGSDSGQYMSYDGFKVSRALSNEMIQISQPFYEALVEVCRLKSAPKQQSNVPLIPPEAIPAEATAPGDYPERTLPEGTEYA